MNTLTVTVVSVGSNSGDGVTLWLGPGCMVMGLMVCAEE